MIRLFLSAVACTLLAAACGKSEPPAPPAEPIEPAAAPAEPEAPTPDPHAAHDTTAAPAAAMPAAPENAKVSFADPAEGAVVSGPVTDGKVAVPVKMLAEGITIEPAGPVKEGSGHHHILIDGAPLAAGTVVPKDESNLHFGQGQTEATLQLAPGEHTLVMQLADGIHRSYGPGLSAQLKITVKGE